MTQHVEIHDHGMGNFELTIDGVPVTGVVGYRVEHAIMKPARVHITLATQRCDVDVDAEIGEAAG